MHQQPSPPCPKRQDKSRQRKWARDSASKSDILAKKTGAVADGHTASNAPDLFRPPKLSGAGPGQYWGGGPPGKTSGCCQLFVKPLSLSFTRAGAGGARLCFGCTHNLQPLVQSDRTSPRNESGHGAPRARAISWQGRRELSLTAIPRRMHRISSDLRS